MVNRHADSCLIDGAFFLRRFKHSFPHLDVHDPEAIALGVRWLTVWHLSYRSSPQAMNQAITGQGFLPIESSELYRIFFYDCPPLTKRMHCPVSRSSLNLAQTTTARFRHAVHQRLQAERKVALRLGRLNDDVAWRLKPEASKRLISQGTSFTAVDEDFEPDIKQKGVDMRLGLDVSALAFKRQVDQIVLVAGDGDFVPAAKLARREGIDVVLDPMGATAAKDLLQHVDGVRQARMIQPLAGPS